jgi:hypothetical protein
LNFQRDYEDVSLLRSTKIAILQGRLLARSGKLILNTIKMTLISRLAANTGWTNHRSPFDERAEEDNFVASGKIK